MPLFTHGTQYEFIEIYYGKLGSSISEIALSPLEKPAIFFGQLFRPTNLYFLLLFLLPALACASAKARYFLGFSGILAFIFVKDSNLNCTINSSYQAEILALLYVAAVLGATALKQGGIEGLQPLLSGLGGRLAIPSDKLAHAAIASSVLAAALCFYLFALGCPFGKNAWTRKYMTTLDFAEDLARWKESIPPGVPLSTSTRIGAHFFLRNTVHNLVEASDEYVLMDLNDELDSGIETYRRRLALSENYSLVRFETVKKHTWLLFKRGRPDAARPSKTTFHIKRTKTGLRLASPSKSKGRPQRLPGSSRLRLKSSPRLQA